MLRQTLRTLRKSRGVTVVAVLALALGIGANTAVFSVVNAVFLRPLPYPDARRLVTILETNDNNQTSVSYPDFLDWRPQASAFQAMAAVASGTGAKNARFGHENQRAAMLWLINGVQTLTMLIARTTPNRQRRP